jgi:hypothetical protein
MQDHENGHILLFNIHDKANLVALCSFCHFAFDNDEWMIIPEETTTWRQRIEATPQTVEEYRSQKNILYQQLLLDPHARSTASEDTHYASVRVLGSFNYNEASLDYSRANE